MKSKAAVQIGLAIAISGYLPHLSGGYQIASAVVVIILALSSIILYFHERFSNTLWKELVKISESIEIGRTVFGVGLFGAGISLLSTTWWPLGVMFLLLGALAIGSGIGKNLGRVKTRKAKQ